MEQKTNVAIQNESEDEDPKDGNLDTLERESAKYIPTTEELHLLVPALLEYFEYDDTRSKRRSNIAAICRKRLLEINPNHWKTQRIVRLWFNNNKNKYIGPNKPISTQDSSQLLMNHPNALLPNGMPMRTPQQMQQLNQQIMAQQQAAMAGNALAMQRNAVAPGQMQQPGMSQDMQIGVKADQGSVALNTEMNAQMTQMNTKYNQEIPPQKPQKKVPKKYQDTVKNQAAASQDLGNQEAAKASESSTIQALPFFDYSDKFNLTSQQYNYFRQSCIAFMSTILYHSLEVSKSDLSPEERFNKQKELSEEVNKLRAYGRRNHFVQEGKFPANLNLVPVINATPLKSKSDAQTGQTQQYPNQSQPQQPGLPASETESDDNLKHLVQKRVNCTMPKIPTTSYTPEQVSFIKGQCAISFFAQSNVEKIVPYEGGILLVRFVSGFSNLVKLSIQHDTWQVECTSKTGLYSHVTSMKVVEELNLVFICGDKRIKSFSLDNLEYQNTYGLDNVYEKTCIEYFNEELIVAVSNNKDTEGKMFIWDIDAIEPNDSVDIDEEIAEEGGFNLSFVKGGSGSKCLRTIETDYPILTMKTVGSENLVIAYEDQPFASVINREFLEVIRLVGHTEDIIGLCSYDNDSILTSSKDFTIRKWSVETGELQLGYTHLTSFVRSMCFSVAKNIPVLFIGTEDGNVRCFDGLQQKEAFIIKDNSSYYDFLAYFNDTLVISQPEDPEEPICNRKITLAVFNYDV